MSARSPSGTGELVEWVRKGEILAAYHRCRGPKPGLARGVVHVDPSDCHVSIWDPTPAGI